MASPNAPKKGNKVIIATALGKITANSIGEVYGPNAGHLVIGNGMGWDLCHVAHECPIPEILDLSDTAKYAAQEVFAPMVTPEMVDRYRAASGA